MERYKLTEDFLNDENIKGYMTAAWQLTLPQHKHGLLYDAAMFSQAKKLIYPEE